jgi:molybdenum cofactor cytidylyltransferase
MSGTSVIILAAGASTRLGKPKQLLPWRGSSLLQHAIDVARPIHEQPIVVLGSQANDIEKTIHNAHIVHNPHWKEGIASSIRAGLEANDRQQVIFMVCDQPFVTTAVLNELVLAHQKTAKPIIASAYAGTVGIPALFDHTFFTQLLDLKGDTGAKKLLQQYSLQVWPVPFPMGHVDIDTAEEYDAIFR